MPHRKWPRLGGRSLERDMFWTRSSLISDNAAGDAVIHLSASERHHARRRPHGEPEPDRLPPHLSCSGSNDLAPPTAGRDADRAQSSGPALLRDRPFATAYRQFGRGANKRRHGAYSITTSAHVSTVGGMLMPSALAVWRFMTSSYLVGRSTGRSPGFAPLKILSTKVADRRN